MLSSLLMRSPWSVKVGWRCSVLPSSIPMFFCMPIMFFCMPIIIVARAMNPVRDNTISPMIVPKIAQFIMLPLSVR